MLQRFVSASVVASIAIACGALALLIATPIWPLQKTYLLPILWSFVPLVWGVWAMLTPISWMPDRLPNWGAVLGLIAGVMATFVLHLPARILGEAVRIRTRGLIVFGAVLAYYVLWIAVRMVYRALRSPAQAEKEYKAAA